MLRNIMHCLHWQGRASIYTPAVENGSETGRKFLPPAFAFERVSGVYLELPEAAQHTF